MIKSELRLFVVMCKIIFTALQAKTKTKKKKEAEECFDRKKDDEFLLKLNIQ